MLNFQRCCFNLLCEMVYQEAQEGHFEIRCVPKAMRRCTRHEKHHRKIIHLTGCILIKLTGEIDLLNRKVEREIIQSRASYLIAVRRGYGLIGTFSLEQCGGWQTIQGIMRSAHTGSFVSETFGVSNKNEPLKIFVMW